ncbi:hypothetical protein ICE98_03476 [Lactococcus lactis]|nr:hypothetical protein [Lactococcus lactis]
MDGTVYSKWNTKGKIALILVMKDMELVKISKNKLMK